MAPIKRKRCTVSKSKYHKEQSLKLTRNEICSGQSCKFQYHTVIFYTSSLIWASWFKTWKFCSHPPFFFFLLLDLFSESISNIFDWAIILFLYLFSNSKQANGAPFPYVWVQIHIWKLIKQSLMTILPWIRVRRLLKSTFIFILNLISKFNKNKHMYFQ